MASTKANAAATECSTFAGGCCLSVGRGKECKYIHLGEPGEIECTISVKKYCTAKCLYKHGGGASDFLLGNVPAVTPPPPPLSTRPWLTRGPQGQGPNLTRLKLG